VPHINTPQAATNQTSDAEIVGVDTTGQLSRTGWSAPEQLSQNRWLEIGKNLALYEGAIQWWLGDWWAYGDQRRWGDGEEIAEQIGIDYSTIRIYAVVARSVSLLRRRNNLTFGHHREVAPLTPEQQDNWLDKATTGHWSVNQLRCEIARATAISRTQRVAFKAAQLGRYVVILADPPLRYANPPIGPSNRSIENHYPTMTIEEICALPVPDIAHENSILFLWATSPMLVECMQIIAAWDFTYRTSLVWVKDKIGTGYHVRNKHELLLIAKRGELPPPQPENRPESVVFAERGDHSAKPLIVYDLIETMYPALAGQRIELFARASRPGWASWGNQVLDTVAPDSFQHPRLPPAHHRG
jgi:N6-adenosine-specific RNA methylase IME4